MDIGEVCKDNGKIVELSDAGMAFIGEPIVSCNKKILDQLAVLNGVAPTGLSVLITGEPGTRKEMYAEYIHQKSRRAEKPYMRFDCVAVSVSNFEKELFGSHSYAEQRFGILEMASGGTVLLDGISEIPCAAYGRLRQFIEDGVVSKKNDDERHADVRLISTSSEDILSIIKNNEAAAKMYEMLAAIRIEVIPLRRRPEDIALLALEHLHSANEKYGVSKKMGSALFKAILDYEWFGNEKELREQVERLIMMTPTSVLDDVEMFENLVRPGSAIPQNTLDRIYGLEETGRSLKDIVNDYEIMIIRQSIRRHKSLRKAAAALQTAPSVLSRKLSLAKVRESDCKER